MDTQLIRYIGRKLEPAGVILLLLFAENINAPLLVKAINVTSYGIVALLIIGKWKRFAYVATRDLPLLLLVSAAVVSVFWSAAPEYTSVEVRALLRSTLFGAYLATRYTSREQMRLCAWVCGIAALLSFAIVLAQPSEGIHFVNNEPCWRGIYAHKQYLGRTMTIGAMVFLLTLFESQKYWWIGLAGLGWSVVLILGTRSKTGLMLLLFSLLLLPLYNALKQNYKLQVVLFLIILLVGGSLAVLILGNLQYILVDVLGKDMDFNGRVPIWTLAIEKGLERPWLGYGYSGFWTSPDSHQVINSSWAGTEENIAAGTRFHAHSGFVDLFLQLGWLGVSLFILNLLKVFQRVVTLGSLTKTIESFWMLQMITLMLLFNFSETITILSTNHIFWIFYVSIALSSAIQLNQIKTNILIKQNGESQMNKLINT